MKTGQDRYIINSLNPVIRIEFFSYLNSDHLNPQNPLLRMGLFRVKRNDCARGTRYFISDMRTECNKNNASNAIVLYDATEIEYLSMYNILPDYMNDDIRIYRYDRHEFEEFSIVINENGVNTISH